MGRAVVLHTWMLHLDDWNEVLMDRFIIKITHFMNNFERIIGYEHQHSVLLYTFANKYKNHAFTNLDGIA